MPTSAKEETYISPDSMCTLRSAKEKGTHIRRAQGTPKSAKEENYKPISLPITDKP